MAESFCRGFLKENPIGFGYVPEKQFPVSVRGDADNIPEQSGKVLRVFQTDLGCDMCQCQVGVQHQINGLVHTVNIDIIQDRQIHMLKKNLAQIAGRDVQMVSDILNQYLPCIIFMDIREGIGDITDMYRRMAAHISENGQPGTFRIDQIKHQLRQMEVREGGGGGFPVCCFIYDLCNQRVDLLIGLQLEMRVAGKNQCGNQIQGIWFRIIQIPFRKQGGVKMDMPEGTGRLCFQVEGMHCVRWDQYKVTGGADDFLTVDIHGTAAGFNKVNFDGLVDMLRKAVSVFSRLLQRTDDRLSTEKNFSFTRKVFVFQTQVSAHRNFLP